MAFSLRTLFYVFGLLASGLSAFGVWGLLSFVLVLGFWKLRSKGVRTSWLQFTVIGCAALVGMALLIPALQPARRTINRRADGFLNMKILALGIHNYEGAHGKLPAAIVANEFGEPLHSWRTLIWPFIERNIEYEQIDLTQPWNARVHTLLRDSYTERFTDLDIPVASSQPGATSYLAVYDNRTMWPKDGALTLDDIADGADQTLAVMEVGNSTVHFMEPRDLTFKEAVGLLTGEIDDGFPFRSRRERLVVFADGHLASMPVIDEAMAIALLTRAGGEDVSAELKEIQMRRQSSEIWHDFASELGQWWAIGVFVALAILPALVLHKSPATT